jgi:hypothetical protein
MACDNRLATIERTLKVHTYLLWVVIILGVTILCVL